MDANGWHNTSNRPAPAAYREGPQNGRRSFDPQDAPEGSDRDDHTRPEAGPVSRVKVIVAQPVSDQQIDHAIYQGITETRVRRELINFAPGLEMLPITLVISRCADLIGAGHIEVVEGILMLTALGRRYAEAGRGPWTVTSWASASGPDAQWTAKFIDVDVAWEAALGERETGRVAAVLVESADRGVIAYGSDTNGWDRFDEWTTAPQGLADVF